MSKPPIRPLTIDGYGRLSLRRAEIVSAYKAGESIFEIAQRFGANCGSVRRQLRTAGVKVERRKRRARQPPPYTAEAIRRYKSGESSLSIAASVGCDGAGLIRLLRRHHVEIRDASYSRRKHALNETVFDTVTPESAYWVGFLMADGCVHRKTSLSWSVSASSQIADVEHLRAFLRFLGSTSQVRTYRSHGYASKGRLGIVAQVAVSSKRLATALIGFGVVPRKSLVAEVKHLEDDLHFWRGAVDGDGCLRWQDIRGHKSPSLNLCSGSRRFIEQFQAFCQRHCPAARSQIINGGTAWYLSFGGTTAQQMAALLYPPSCVALDRKAKLAAEFATYSAIPHKSWLHITAADLQARFDRLGCWLHVANELGMSDGVCRFRRAALGLPIEEQADWSHITAEQLIELYDRHRSWLEVGRVIGLFGGNLSRLVKRLLGSDYSSRCRRGNAVSYRHGLISCADVAKLYDAPERTAYHWQKRGWIPGSVVKDGKHLGYDPEVVKQWLTSWKPPTPGRKKKQITSSDHLSQV